MQIRHFCVYLTLLFSSFSSIASQFIPSEHFSRLPAFQRLNLSPAGDKLAYVQNILAEDGRSMLAYYDFDKRKQEYLLQSDNVAVKINWFEWANDDILLVSARYESRIRGQRFYQTRLLKIDLREKDKSPENLIRVKKSIKGANGQNMSQFQDSVIDFLPDDPEHILMQIDLEKHAMPAVYKVNVDSGKKKRIEKAKYQIRHWMTDQQHMVRIGRSRDYDETTVRYYHRPQNAEEFEILFEFDMYKDKPISPMGFGLNPNILYYYAYKGDYQVLYKMNLQTKESEELLANDGYDVDGGLIYSNKTKDVIGVHNQRSEYGKHFFDKKHYKLTRGLDKVFEDKFVHVTSLNKDETRYIALVESDNSPPQYYFGDRPAQQIIPLFNQYPELAKASFNKHKKYVYEARDGIKIEAYLSLPTIGEAPYPTVIHPHGGPGARDSAGFDPWVSFMNDRGFAVLRPNFRGSTGYGYKFAQAQMGRWGLEMQDDITDATNWLVEEGIADPAKTCIFGASYGGYAAKMAAVKTPELFACAVSFAGVADLRRLKRTTSSYLGGDLTSENQFGKDNDDLEARSPINFIEKIKTPLLIMHGDQDFVVRVEQSRFFVDELEDANKDFTYVEFEDGDHYLSIQKNRKQFFEELDDFFEEHIGNSSLQKESD